MKVPVGEPTTRFHRTYQAFVSVRVGDQSSVTIDGDAYLLPMRRAGEESLEDLDALLDIIRGKTNRRIVAVFIYQRDEHTGNISYAVVTAPSLF